MTGENVRAQALGIIVCVQIGSGCGSQSLRHFLTPSVDGRSSTEEGASTLGQVPGDANGSNQSIDVDGKSGKDGPNESGNSGAEGTTISTPVGTIVVTPKSPATSTSPCAPKGGPLVGLSLVFDPVAGGALTIDGDAADNIMEVTGGGGPGVVRVINADPSKAMIIPCVKDISVNGGTGNDNIRVGDGFPGIGTLTITGGPGTNNITLFGNISGTSITIN